jgi:hypothetical protein
VIDAMSDASLLRGIGEHQVRLTEQEALLNLRTVLELCAAGGVRCSEKTYRPSATTVCTVDSHFAHGDFFRGDPIASFAWPLLVQAGFLSAGDQLTLSVRLCRADCGPGVDSLRGEPRPGSGRHARWLKP